MILLYKKCKFILISLLCLGMFSCVDDGINPEDWDDSLPEDLKEGYSLIFRMSLDPMGGSDFRSRASSDMKDTEDFIDLEKVRVLFFTCQDSEGDTYPENGKQYDSGKHDYFLFESSSRWVSEMGSTSLNASKLWQITTPIFPYGNQDLEYNWENIREALTTKPFKIVVLANRPPRQAFPDYDGALDGGEENFYFENDGPNWTYEQSWANNKEEWEQKRDEWEENPDKSPLKTINDLHHCQWDPVYASKNLVNATSGTGKEFNGNNIYDFIMENPKQTIYEHDGENGTGKNPVNLMGAVSQWTIKGNNKPLITSFASNSTTSSNNYAVHPKRNDEKIGGIPMYGVQKFNPVTNWALGTPFNVSENQLGQDNTYYGKTLSLLRSVVRLDLMIPKSYIYNHTRYDITLKDVCLRYSNVMARVVPLDAATPTDLLWSYDNCNETTRECEWYTIQDKGPIIAGDYEDASSKPALLPDARVRMMNRMKWYYGAWRKWWHYNKESTGIDPSDYTDNVTYPHIFNPCVQRNAIVWLDGEGETKVIVDDDSYYHYVVYTGERYINDPSNFRKLTVDNSKICFFQFTISYKDNGQDKDKTYQVAVTDYAKNDLIKNYLKSLPFTDGSVYKDMENGNDSFRNLMVTKNEPAYWNWILLRNHIYRFQISSFGNLKDEDGIDGMVISTEERLSPDITYK